jgi:hypothetical protein
MRFLNDMKCLKYDDVVLGFVRTENRHNVRRFGSSSSSSWTVVVAAKQALWLMNDAHFEA